MNAAIARHAAPPDLRLVAMLPARDDPSTAAWQTSRRRPEAVEGPGEEDVKAALARIVASAAFRHSARHRSFLRYIVVNTLAGRARALKEVVIGLDVFERSLDRFDPRRDSIVRVEARRLRKKLRSYYEGEGAHDDVEIRLDIGGYVPRFLARTRVRERAATPLVLVVPFVASDDSAGRLIAAGLCDQLTDSLGAIDGIRVMATFGPSRAHRTLDGLDTVVVPDAVDYVIDGSLIHLGSRWRCVAHLTSVQDGIRRWSKTFDHGLGDGVSGGDPFALQDRVAAALSAAVRSELERID